VAEKENERRLQNWFGQWMLRRIARGLSFSNAAPITGHRRRRSSTSSAQSVDSRVLAEELELEDSGMGCVKSTNQKLDEFGRPVERRQPIQFQPRKRLEQSMPTLNDVKSIGRIEEKYDVDFTKEIGSGQFAIVRPCFLKSNGRLCAAKLIDRRRTSEARLATEIDILKRVRGHPNTVGLFDVYVTESEVQLVMEYVSGGELFEHLVAKGPYSEAEAAQHMRRIVSAVDYLHRHGIVHRDLKPENLLLTSKDPRLADIKVADFGLARIYTDTAMQTVCGTWAYAAPEVRNDLNGYGPKVDVWSLGVILFVLLAAYHPFDPKGSASEEELWHNVEHCIYSFQGPSWRRISENAKDLISRMLVVDPSDRLSAAEVLSHPWLCGYEHNIEPLSDAINRDLEQVRAKYARAKFSAASKAVWAQTAFVRAVKPPVPLSPSSSSAPFPIPKTAVVHAPALPQKAHINRNEDKDEDEEMPFAPEGKFSEDLTTI